MDWRVYHLADKHSALLKEIAKVGSRTTPISIVPKNPDR